MRGALNRLGAATSAGESVCETEGERREENDSLGEGLGGRFRTDDENR